MTLLFQSPGSRRVWKSAEAGGAILLTGIFDRKYPRNIETEMDVSVKEVTGRFVDESTLGHSGRIREMELKYVPARFDIKTKGNRIVGIR